MKIGIVTCAIVFAAPALAAEPYVGKWGPDLRSCRAEPTFTLTTQTIDSPTFGCRHVTYTGAGQLWSAQAKQCTAEGEDKETSMTFKVVMKAGKLQIDWGREGQSDWLVRCGG